MLWLTPTQSFRLAVTVTMPRPGKRARISQLANNAKKEQKLQSSPGSDTEEERDFLADCHSDLEWSEVEEDLNFPIAQPAEGWNSRKRTSFNCTRRCWREVSLYTVYHIKSRSFLQPSQPSR